LAALYRKGFEFSYLLQSLNFDGCEGSYFLRKMCRQRSMRSANVMMGSSVVDGAKEVNRLWVDEALEEDKTVLAGSWNIYCRSVQ
jgi:hypothetical protein